MSKWDELKEKYGMMFELSDPLLAKVWTVGDEMNATIKIQDEQLLQESLKMEETEELLQLANGRCNVLAKQLGETQQQNERLTKETCDLAEMGSDDLKKRMAYQKENEALKVVTAKLFNKLADEQKKIETVRRIIVTPDAVDLVDVSFAILAAISEPGVLKEMQKKEE